MIASRPLGRTGLHVSALGYGGAPLGFAPGLSQEEAVDLLHRALDLGITTYDTAPDYRGSETILGEAFATRRDRVVLLTKVGRTQTPDEAGGWNVHEDWSEAGVLQSVERSLRALQTDWLDLVQLHSPPMEVLLRGEAQRGLERAREQGKALHIGVSADGDEAWWAVLSGFFETLQVSHSVLQQGPAADGLVDAATERGMGLIAKQPVANGIADLSVRPEHPDWSWKWDAAQRMDLSALGVPGTRTTGALRWTLADPRIATAIVGTTNPAHLEANAEAAAEPFGADTYLQLRGAFDRALQQQ